MTKSKEVVARGRGSKVLDKFRFDEKKDEFERPGPQIDADFRGIALGLSKLNERANTGFVLKWRPLWLKKEGLPAFGAFFMDDRLAVDLFNRDRKEMDALADDLTQAQKNEVAFKTALCKVRNIRYLYLGPDDDLDIVQLAARIGKTKVVKPEEIEGQE